MTSIFPKYLSLGVALCLSSFALGQDLYTVRAGLFRDVLSSDFTEIKDLGYVYNQGAIGNETEVFVGQFSKQEAAAAALKSLKERGFRNATVETLKAAGAPMKTFVQFALHDAQGKITWKAYEELGVIHAQPVDGSIKLLTGPYANQEAAKQALASLEKLGHSDAFIRVLPTTQLVEIDEFETGLKRPLIPITYNSSEVSPNPASPEATPATDPAPEEYGKEPQTPPVSPSTAPASAPPVTTMPPAAAPPPTLPAPAAVASLPAIDGRTSRPATTRLQGVLKDQNFYDGALDGLYGPGTTAAYRKAWDNHTEIRKYRTLAGAAFAPVDEERNAVTQWPEVAVLLAIAHDLSAGKTNVILARQTATQRATLFNAPKKLTDDVAKRSNDWATKLWANLDNWAGTDPLHEQIVTALRISYYQTQTRLEAHYTAHGFGETEARNLATAMMQNLISAQLERFR